MSRLEYLFRVISYSFESGSTNNKLIEVKMKLKIGIMIFLLFSMTVNSIFSSGNSEIKDEAADMNSVSMSGKVENGLRVIPVELSGENIILDVYRGDYIVIKVSDGKSHHLVIPSLEVDNQIPVPEDEKPYIKMKETGSIAFFLDDISGTINIINFDGPRYWELSTQEGADLIKDIDPFILDVRTEGEYKEGHLEEAFLLPVQILEQEIGLIDEYKDRDILIYCRSGNRSTVASKILLDAGFTNVYNLRYGINGWSSEGLPIVVE
jgi:rhodanese-related sulfurtransferase